MKTMKLRGDRGETRPVTASLDSPFADQPPWRSWEAAPFALHGLVHLYQLAANARERFVTNSM